MSNDGRFLFLCPEQVKNFRDDGYLLIPSLYGTDEVGEIREHFHGNKERLKLRILKNMQILLFMKYIY